MRTILVSLLFAPSFALAGEGTTSATQPPPQAQTLRSSFSEAFLHPQLSNNFKLLDGNADGLLSRAEVAGIAR